jgi:thioredoxin 2
MTVVNISRFRGAKRGGGRRAGVSKKLIAIKATSQTAHHPQRRVCFGVPMADALHIVCPHCDAINRVPRERLRNGGKCGSCHRPLFEGRPAALDSAARFNKHAERSDIPLLVDFWASWCGPCRTMAPIFEQAATQLEPDVRLVKVDSDAVPELLQRFSIQSIPTLMLVHHGREIARQSGIMPLTQLLAWTREHASGVKA